MNGGFLWDMHIHIYHTWMLWVWKQLFFLLSQLIAPTFWKESSGRSCVFFLKGWHFVENSFYNYCYFGALGLQAADAFFKVLELPAVPFRLRGTTWDLKDSTSFRQKVGYKAVPRKMQGCEWCHDPCIKRSLKTTFSEECWWFRNPANHQIRTISTLYHTVNPSSSCPTYSPKNVCILSLYLFHHHACIHSSPTKMWQMETCGSSFCLLAPYNTSINIHGI